MNITFYDFAFKRLGEFAKPISVNIEKKYCGYGNAELHFDISETDLVYLLADNEYLFIVIDDNSVIVTGWQLGEDIAIYARTPEWLLTKRGAEPLSFENKTPEVIARNTIESVSDFVALGELSNVGTETNYSTEEVRNLYDVICEILNIQCLGFEVFPDISAKAFVFRVYCGEEVRCMFSTSNRTAYNVKYSVEKQDAATNSGWYKRRYKDMGGWDASENTPVLSNNLASNAYTFYKITSEDTIKQFGLSCTQGSYLYCDNTQGTWKISPTKPDNIWIYIDNASKSGLQKWDAVLEGTKTEEEAKTEILQLTTQRNINCETYRLEYGSDYHLGDVVRVQLEFENFKETEERRITSVNIYYDIDCTGVIPILNSLGD